MLFTDNSGQVLLNADGTIIDDTACCCQACPGDCSGCSLSTAQVTFPAAYSYLDCSFELVQGTVGGNCGWGGYADLPKAGVSVGVTCGQGCWYVTLGTEGNPFLLALSAALGCGEACPSAGTYTLQVTQGPTDAGPITVTIS